MSVITTYLSNQPSDDSVEWSCAARHFTRTLGSVLILCGGLADLATGWLTLAHMTRWSIILVHVPSTFIWCIGWGLAQWIAQPSTVRPMWHSRNALLRTLRSFEVVFLHGWVPVIFLLSLFLFPGLAFAAWCVVMVFSKFMHERHQPLTREILDELIPHGDAVSASPGKNQPGVGVGQRVQGRNLAKITQTPDAEERRAAIAVLRKSGRPAVAHEIRALLKDQHPDVRTDASVALAHLDATMASRFFEAKACSEQSAEDALAFARLCFDYATSGVLDSASSDAYLELACSVLSKNMYDHAIQAEAMMLMAQIEWKLGQATGALQVIRQTIALETPQPAAYRLGAEYAFKRHDWATLHALAQKANGTQTPPDGNEADVLRWWATA